MDELEPGSDVHYLRDIRTAKGPVCEDSHCRPDPLAARVDDMQGGVSQNLFPGLHHFVELLINQVELLLDAEIPWLCGHGVAHIDHLLLKRSASWIGRKMSIWP